MLDWIGTGIEQADIEAYVSLSYQRSPPPTQLISALPAHFHREHVTSYTPTVLLFNSCVKIKPISLHSSRLKKGMFWYLSQPPPFRKFIFQSQPPPLFLHSCLSSRLARWFPGSGLHKVVEILSQAYRVKVLGRRIKKKCLTSRCLKGSQNNTELRGRHSALGPTPMLHKIKLLASEKVELEVLRSGTTKILK